MQMKFYSIRKSNIKSLLENSILKSYLVLIIWR